MRHALISMFVLLVGSWLTAQAQHITPEEALGIAQRFYDTRITTQGKSATAPKKVEWVRAMPMSEKNMRSTETEAFYVFNASGRAGFVIVAADERAHSILGYATTGTFSFENMPSALKNWLRTYEEQIDRLTDGDGASTTYAGEMPCSVYEGVAPLLGGIVWNQDAPFNHLCPIDRYYNETTPVGCGAVAAAQIMRFWRYPEQGIGSRSYLTETNRQSVSADFASTTYDWAHMRENYNEGFNTTEAEAVATLCYHVAAAMKMDFNYEGSGATAKEMAKSFTRYFGYDANTDYVPRSHYDEQAWEALLRAELDAGRPILYMGEGEGGGHAFVCDGYDEMGWLHFNWGWGGMSNGFFRSSALSPEYLGIGGGLGSYNHNQAVIIGIQPPTEGSKHLAQVHLAQPITPKSGTVERNAGNDFTVSFYNYGLRPFSGEAALALYDDNGNCLAILASKALNNIPELTGGTSGTTFTDVCLPADIIEGTYRLHAVQRENGAADYTVMRTPPTKPNHLIVRVGTEQVEYATPDYTAHLTLIEHPQVLTPLYHGRKASFSVTVRNDGKEFYSYLGILIQEKNSSESPARQYVGTILTRIPEGETRTFNYSTNEITLPAGEYDIVAIHDATNNYGTYFDPIGPDSLMVQTATIKPEPEEPIFELTDPIYVKPAAGEILLRPNQLLHFRAPLRNVGGYGDGDFAMLFFDRSETLLGNTNVVSVSMDAGEEREVEIVHKLNYPAGQYGMIFASVNGNEASIVEPAEHNAMVFRLYAPVGLNTAENETRLSCSAAGDLLSVALPRESERITIYDTTGRCLFSESTPETPIMQINTCGWSAGTYIIRTEGRQSRQTVKIVLK